ncbi:MAG: hypothetical protein FWC91_11140 [Defluviitaleaceae bacterium]|nr:hypothetical protein [Defluviitaleaceae bacterium]
MKGSIFKRVLCILTACGFLLAAPAVYSCNNVSPTAERISPRGNHSSEPADL